VVLLYCGVILLIPFSVFDFTGLQPGADNRVGFLAWRMDRSFLGFGNPFAIPAVKLQNG